MNLHRSDSKPDWENVDQKKRTIWQRIAAATNGIVTPANLATLIGFGLVVVGLLDIINENYWWGSALIIVGRLFDLLDGWLAESTKTKSPLGELLDAAIDKVGTILTIVAFYIATLAPWWVLSGLLLPHVIIIFISLNARRRGVQLHPSRIGKLSMAAVWVALFGLVFIKALDWPLFSIGTVLVYSVATLSVVLGAAAATGYLFSRR
jgi:phosphatidylglycerophosphate synthase